MKLQFRKPSGREYRILCLGAHCDDIEIGCGGTILKLLDDDPNCVLQWRVFSSDEQREREARKSAEVFLKDAKSANVDIMNFRDGFFPYVGLEIKEAFEQFKQEFEPDLIFTHYRHDLHQDHRMISELTWNTFRDHLILEYEIPKYDGDLGSPNLFVHIDEAICRKKVRYLLECFKTQVNRQWYSEETFLSILRLRGFESNAPSGYSEAFYCRKMVF